MTPTDIEKLKEQIENQTACGMSSTARELFDSLIAALEAAQGENQELRRAAQDEAILKTRLNAVSAAKDAEIERLSGCLKAEADRLDAKCGELLRSNLALVAAEAALKEARDRLTLARDWIAERNPFARVLLQIDPPKQDSGGRS